MVPEEPSILRDLEDEYPEAIHLARCFLQVSPKTSHCDLLSARDLFDGSGRRLFLEICWSEPRTSLAIELPFQSVCVTGFPWLPTRQLTENTLHRYIDHVIQRFHGRKEKLV